MNCLTPLPEDGVVYKLLSILRQERRNVEQLRLEKEEILQRLSHSNASVLAKLESYRTELARLKEQISATTSSMNACLATIGEKYAEFRRSHQSSLDSLTRENRILMRMSSVSSRTGVALDTSVKSHSKFVEATLKNVQKSKPSRCIRCKVLRNVIKNLEKQLVRKCLTSDSLLDKYKCENDCELPVSSTPEMQRKSGDITKASRDNQTDYDVWNAQTGSNVCPENSKISCDSVSSSSSSSSARQQLIVEVSRTPTDQLSDSSDATCSQKPLPSQPQHQLIQQHQQLLDGLRCSLEAKNTEYQKLHLKFEHVTNNRERLKLELAAFKNENELAQLKLKRATDLCEQQRTQLDQTQRQMTVLQTLLTNLASGIVDVFT